MIAPDWRVDEFSMDGRKEKPSIGDLTALSREDLKSLTAMIHSRGRELKAQVSAIRRCHAATGKRVSYEDLEAYDAATAWYSATGQLCQLAAGVATRMAKEAARASVAARSRTIEQRFIAVAKRRLAERLFLELLEEAREEARLADAGDSRDGGNDGDHT